MAFQYSGSPLGEIFESSLRRRDWRLEIAVPEAAPRHFKGDLGGKRHRKAMDFKCAVHFREPFERLAA